MRLQHFAQDKRVLLLGPAQVALVDDVGLWHWPGGNLGIVMLRVLVVVLALHVLGRVLRLLGAAQAPGRLDCRARLLKMRIQLTLDHFMGKVLQQTRPVPDHALLVIIVRVVLERIVHFNIF